MVAIAIVAIMATLALPNFIGPAAESRLRGAGDNLRGDLQLARARAVRDNVPVALVFTAEGYTLFTDGGSTLRTLDLGETVIRTRRFDAGVQCNLTATDFTDKAVRFNSRGRAEQSGTMVLTGRNGEQVRMVLSLLGQITVQ
jgi:Tfp pilus assembly protein FimT